MPIEILPFPPVYVKSGIADIAYTHGGCTGGRGGGGVGAGGGVGGGGVG